MNAKAMALVALVLGAGVGFAAGARSGAERFDRLDAAMTRLQARVAELGQAPAPRARIVARAGSPDPSAQQLASVVREVLRDELDDFAAEMCPANVAAEQQPQEREASQAQIAAEGAAQQLVANARQSGFWSLQHRDELRRLYPELTSPQQEKLMQTLLPAINRGEIRTEGPPL